jgi:hypothetical protein
MRTWVLVGATSTVSSSHRNERRNGLFRVYSVKDEPANAHVAIPYKGYWFYIDRTDQDTKSTFSLLLELSRLEVLGKPGAGPVLTLPISGR